MHKKALLTKKIPDGKLMCTTCSHYCVLQKGEYGKCGIRKHTGTKIVQVNYGKALGINRDPIEKKPLFHFLPGSEILSFGTSGCNFSCVFCQNRYMSQAKRFPEIAEQGEDRSPKEIVDYANKHKVPSIAYTYNEPTIFFDYAYDTMKRAHRKGINNIRVSNGFMSHECREAILPYLDAINIDFKSFQKEFYTDICGGAPRPILDNIKFFVQQKVHVELTTLLIPGENDSKEETTSIASRIANLDPNIPRHISAFYPTYMMSDKAATSEEKLIEAYDIGKQQ